MTSGISPGLFVAGTDTGVGKTLVTAALVKLLRRNGVAAVPFKPIHTGCPHAQAAPDLDFVLAGVEEDPGSLPPRDLLAPCRFRHPCSPHLAARLEQRAIDIARIFDCLRRLRRGGLFPVVEGTGGLMVPVSPYYSMLDILSAMSLPVVLVTRRSLGTLNHTFLSLALLRQRLIRVVAVVFNAVQQDATPEYIARDNARTIREWGRVPQLGNIPFIPGCADRPAALVSRAAEHLDLIPLGPWIGK